MNDNLLRNIQLRLLILLFIGSQISEFISDNISFYVWGTVYMALYEYYILRKFRSLFRLSGTQISFRILYHYFSYLNRLHSSVHISAAIWLNLYRAFCLWELLIPVYHLQFTNRYILSH